jgi:hypothetical protein
MPYFTRKHKHGETRHYRPDDDENTIFIEGSFGVSLKEIQDRIHEKWGCVDPDKIIIEPRHIHTDCLGYDSYDSSDYTDYLMITRKV